MPDKIDIQAVTRALENGKGCEVHDKLASIPWQEQSQIFKDIRNANQEHIKSEPLTPRLHIIEPRKETNALGVSSQHASIERAVYNPMFVFPSMQTLIDERINLQGKKQTVCTDVTPNGPVTKLFNDKRP